MTKPKPIKVEVKAIDIKRGIPGDVKHCPVALAVLRATKASTVSVGYSIDWEDNSMSIPQKVHRFIERFDEGKPVKPFSFMLRASA